MSFLVSHQCLGDVARAKSVGFVLHGALGSGQNFRRFVQRLREARPEYAFVLVDLRNHGDSRGAPPPHDLASCARDLTVLSQHLQVEPSVVIGHSFGGKVALEYGRQQASVQDSCLLQLWVLDAVPGPQSGGGEIAEVIAAVRAVPMPANSRAEVVAALKHAGLSSGIAEWMSTNLRRVEGAYQWRFELSAIEESLADYFRVDLWPFVEQLKPGLRVEMVVAEQSDRFTGEMRKRVQRLADEGRVSYRCLPRSGHWVHVDNPDGLLAMLDEHLT